MFITNELTPAELLAELLKGRRTSAEATDQFKVLRHDKNLLPRFDSHMHAILDVYMAYRTGVHDVQGIRDDGVDVLLRLKMNDDEYRVGLQIKSDYEFDQWEKKKAPFVKDLKAQYSAAMENARVDDYYVVLCADDRKHRKRIRTVCSELKNYRQCTIIEPREALGFYAMSELDLNIRTTRLLCHTDIILRKALSESDVEEPATAFFLTSLVVHTFKDGLHIDETELSEIWWHWSKLAEEFAGSDDRVANVTEKLLDHGLVKETGESYLIDITRLPHGICALFFDLQIRELADGSNIRDYIVGLLELRNRAEAEMADENDDYDDDDYDVDDHDDEVDSD